MRQVDYHRKKLYNAEVRAFRDPFLTDVVAAHRFKGMDEAIAAVRRYEAMPVWQELLAAVGKTGHAPITLDESRSATTSWANFSRHHIQVCRRHYDGWVLLHEMAHLVTLNAMPAHGREFNGAYLRLIAAAMGDDAAASLRRELVAAKVPFERDAKYVAYLRRNLRAVAANPDGYDPADIILVDGSTLACTRFAFDVDTVTPEYRWTNAASPVRVGLDEIAYLSAPRRRDVWRQTGVTSLQSLLPRV